jgi:hypothetical protein
LCGGVARYFETGLAEALHDALIERYRKMPNLDEA